MVSCCDFYIASWDLFIELNAHWTHGGHWFDATNDDDLRRLQIWRSKKSTYYESAIHIWTERDPLKRKVAVLNGLNYLVFWDVNLHDSKEWLKSFVSKYK